MALIDAQKFFDQQPGDPDEGYIAPNRCKQAAAQTYADLTPNDWLVGDGPPSDAAGDTGDWYLDRVTGDLWRKQP